MKKAQTSFEFIVIASLVFLVVVTVTPILINMVFDAISADDKDLLKGQADIMKNRIDTAMQVQEGYYDNFSLASNIEGKSYVIINRNDKKLGFKYVQDDYEYLISLPTGSNVTWEDGKNVSNFNFLITNKGNGIRLYNYSN
jgi:hypothetical protein